jgi:hypothetical protein
MVEKFAIYIAAKVTSHPGLITIYTAYHPEKLITEISILLQIKHTHAFSFETLDFLFVPEYSAPGENIYCRQTWEYNFCCQNCACRLSCSLRPAI